MRIKISLCLFALALTFTASSAADEVVIGRHSGSRVQLGDFDCSGCPINSLPKLLLSSGDGGFEISTGKLWQFLDQQGVSSADKLTFCLDLDSVDDDLKFLLSGVELRIESPEPNEEFLTNVSLGENSILIPGYETSSLKPEAKLEVALGYDFMKRFSDVSPQKVFVSFEFSGDQAVCNPTLCLQSNSLGFFSNSKNFFLLAGFALFWTCVFHLLNRFTKPSPVGDQPTETPSVQVEPALALTRVEPQKVMSA